MSLLNFFHANRTNNTSSNVINSDEYDRVLKRISELDANFKLLKVDVDVLRTDVSNLRGKFNQRLKGLKEEEQKQEIESFNNSGEVPFG
jgi:hypothetical protein